MLKLNLSERITSIRMFSCAVEIEYQGQGKIKLEQCWAIKISQRGCETRGFHAIEASSTTEKDSPTQR